ncbi:glutathione S-transferase [Simplicispira psychrophila]|uniref:glutathione S-transferase n=1 Tax=Simplicispira psychrophila TaxID=80882 RepID=UPI000489C6C0|nr:glutathione S-transferase [Simplicispira psychrophila]
MSVLPILYSFRRCPYAIRARLALAVAQQPYQLHEVLLRDKPAALLAASPKGTVPVLVLPEGRVLDQSLDIMCWALQRHDPQQWLSPPGATLADMWAWVAQCDGAFKQALDRCKYPQRLPENDPAQARADASEWLLTLETRLADSAYLCGTQAALADVAIFPFVRQFAAIDPPWWHAQPWPHLQRWLQQWLETALFADTMRKHPLAPNPLL